MPKTFKALFVLVAVGAAVGIASGTSLSVSGPYAFLNRWVMQNPFGWFMLGLGLRSFGRLTRV
jgi:hypothetical protein